MPGSACVYVCVCVLIQHKETLSGYHVFWAASADASQ
jgi:hypothetical protein